MDTKKAFCEKCKKDVDFVVINRRLLGRVEDKWVKYKGKIARCRYCGAEVQVPEVDCFNNDVLYREFKKSYDLEYCYN